MNTKSKWMVTLEPDQLAWLQKTAKEVKVHGSTIIQELISRTMKAKDKEFRASLVEAQARIRRQTLEEKKAEIEDELRRLSEQASNGESSV